MPGEIFADLVEEEGPTVGQFESTFSCGARAPVNRAALVSEQLRFEQRLVQGRTVEWRRKVLGGRVSEEWIARAISFLACPRSRPESGRSNRRSRPA